MKWILGCCVGFAAASGEAWAQAGPGPDKLPEVVLVTGVHIETLKADASADATVITQADIDRRGLSQAADVLTLAPGVTVANAGGFGGVTYARIRGSSSSHTLVLVDGVPVNDVSAPGGGFDFGTLDLFGLSRIEILRGPQSTEWGSDAMSGVIAMQTAAPSQPLEWSTLAEAGSFSSLRAGASLGGKSERASGRLSALWRSAEGFSKADEADGNSEDDGHDSVNLSASGTVVLAGSWALNGQARWTRSEIEYDGFPPPFFALGDSRDSTRSDELSGALTLTGDALNGRLGNRIQVAHANIDRTNLNGAATTSSNQGRRDLYRYTGEVRGLTQSKAAFGFEYEDSEADGQNAYNRAVFGLYQWTPVSPVTLSAGVRRDDGDRFGGKTTGNVGAAWRATDDLTLRANWAQGFRAPSIFQTTYICSFCGATAPNPDLKAETSEGYDLGVEWSRAGLSVSLVAFHQDTDNLIDFDFAKGYANIARAEQEGVELNLTAPITGWLSTHLSYTYTDAKDGTGARLVRVPRDSAVFELLVDPPGGFDAVATVRVNGDQADVDASTFGPAVVPSWTRADVALRYAFGSGLELYARIENLFDEQYQQVDGYGTAGLSGVVGVRVKG